MSTRYASMILRVCNELNETPNSFSLERSLDYKDLNYIFPIFLAQVSNLVRSLC